MPGPHLLLVSATAMEMRAFVSSFPGGPGSVPEAPAAPGAPLPRLELPGHSVSLLVCGVGPLAAALSLGRVLGSVPGSDPDRAQADGKCGFDGLLNVGLAGSYDMAAAPVGSLVLAGEERFPEYGVWPDAGECIMGSGLGAGEPASMSLPQAELASGPVLNALALEPDAALGKLALNCHTDERATMLRKGVSLTVAGVSGTPGRARRLASLFQGLTENMEGFALALGALQAGLPFLELRAVSNEAGYRPPGTWDVPAALAALNAAGQMLFSLPAPAGDHK